MKCHARFRQLVLSMSVILYQQGAKIDDWVPAMDQSKSSVGAGLEVGLRRALFDGTTPASLGSLALRTMASTGAKNSRM